MLGEIASLHDALYRLSVRDVLDAIELLAIRNAHARMDAEIERSKAEAQALQEERWMMVE